MATYLRMTPGGDADDGLWDDPSPVELATLRHGSVVVREDRSTWRRETPAVCTGCGLHTYYDTDWYFLTPPRNCPECGQPLAPYSWRR